MIKIVRVDENAKMPEYKTEGSSCADLYSIEEVTLIPGMVTAVRTGIKMEIPEGFEVQIRARSGLASKGVFLPNGIGTIDSDYRGEVKVLMSTIGHGHLIRVGDRIAQMAVKPVSKYPMTEVDSLSDTERGEGGFGSTGV